MTDPTTGIEVPVLAVTLHPQTRQWLTLGGTYCNPLTKTLAPLELGGPMEDPVTGSISPILGVGLDENTGIRRPQCWDPPPSSLPSLAFPAPQVPYMPHTLVQAANHPKATFPPFIPTLLLPHLHPRS